MSTAAELAQELADIIAQQDDLKLRRIDVEERLAADMTEKTFELPGVGVFERHRSAARKQFQHDELKSALLRSLREGNGRLVDEMTGEVVPEDDIERGVRALYECANPSWRKGGLARYGIDVDEFCEVTPGRLTIQFTGSTDR